MEILQANVNHCVAAQDLLFQTLAQWSPKLCVVSEPYYVPPRDNWIGDEKGLVAIVTQATAGCPPVRLITKRAGCVAALVGDIWFVGVYLPPNDSRAVLERSLDVVADVVRQGHPHQVLVAGDFNAHSEAWGSPETEIRGELVENWALSVGLVLLNRGSVPTCVRWQGESIVDLTFATPSLAHQVQDWRVVVGVETLSDHRYIRYKISNSLTVFPGMPASSGGLRWVVASLDREVLEEAAIVCSWVPVSTQSISLEEQVNKFREDMTHICDAAMPRAGNRPCKRQVYWWSSEIAGLRRVCFEARRQFLRRRRQRLSQGENEEDNRLHAAYSEVKKALKKAIAQAKKVAREELLKSLDQNPWGRPYKVVRDKLRPWAPPLTETLEPQIVFRAVQALFPADSGHQAPLMSQGEGTAAVTSQEIEVSEAEMGAAVMRLRAKGNKAPGLDGVPGKALVLALTYLEPSLRSIFTKCLEDGQFPVQWKTGKLVLLRKEGRPIESPSAFRPLVMLDEAGKLLERLIAVRIVKHLERVGPDLSDNQYGFRKRRSTVHAILSVKTLVDNAVSNGGVVLAVSLDIANAFNSMPWDCIKAGLRYHQVPEYLVRTVDSYLSERSVKYPGRDGWQCAVMSCGVPQGSVLGPLLWNIGYDWVLRGSNPDGVGVVCYADDTLVTAVGANYRSACIRATAGVAQVVGRIRRLGLRVALEKSEALCFHGPRQSPPADLSVVVCGVRIQVKQTMKYLGLVLDSRWSFTAHFGYLAPKLKRTAVALSGLLPNIGGPGAACRRLYLGVVRSIALYGSPVWAENLDRRNLPLLRGPQRVIATRVVRGYRTISGEAACVLAGALPWDLDARVLASTYFWREEELSRGHTPAPREIAGAKERFKLEAIAEWERRLVHPSSGARVIDAVRPVFQQWLARRHGILTYRLTQVLTGHGCFGRYLCRVAGREPTVECHHCEGGIEDTAEHTLSSCAAWAAERQALVAVVGENLSLQSLLPAMIGSKRAWKAVAAFAETVMARKEEAEREREATTTLAIRRRRVGRRRRDYARHLPP